VRSAQTRMPVGINSAYAGLTPLRSVR